MKVYYLHLTQDDFTQDGSIWTSDVVDLYENDSYINYSTTKSAKGLNSLSNRVWTGLENTGTDTTDAGRIENGRFIDHTGLINITSFDVVVNSGVSGEQVLAPLINVYNSDDETQPFPTHWASISNLPSYGSIFIPDATRYIRVVLDLNTTTDVSSVDLEFFLRVEIDVPVMAPLYDRTKYTLEYFPEWMEMRDLDTYNSDYFAASPQVATPNTLGSHLINALAGEWLDDIEHQIDYLKMQQYISTADTGQVAWLYLSNEVPTKIYQIEGDGIALARTASLEEFYDVLDTEDAFWWDEFKGLLYTNQQYDELTINGEVFDQVPQRIWNWFDEFGALVDLNRLYLESNESYKNRILDVYINQPGAGVDAFKLALRRELNIWNVYGSTPDSDFSGATPTVLEIADLEQHDDFVDPDGMPKQRFIDLIQYLAEQFPVTWGYFLWDKSVFDVGGADNKGFGLLPYRFDATPMEPEDTQAGVGDNDDLFVYPPMETDEVIDFDATLVVRGRRYEYRESYPEVVVNFELYGTADRRIYNNPVTSVWFSVLVNTDDGNFVTSFQMTAKSDVDVDTPVATANSYASFDLIDDDGFTALDLVWYTASGDPIYSDSATPFRLDWEDVNAISMSYGRYSPSEGGTVDSPTSDTFTAWFESDSGNTLEYGDAFITAASTGGSTPVFPTVIMCSKETSYTVARWESPHQPYRIVLNGIAPFDEPNPITITPNIPWDNYLESPPNKEYNIQLMSSDGNGNYGAITSDSENETVFLAQEYIAVNDTVGWTDGLYSVTASGSLEFSTTTSDVDEFSLVYPVQNKVWFPVEYYQTVPISGKVDKNGPWRNGVAPKEGNSNYALEYVEVDRESFGFPGASNFVPTWMGVTSSSKNVITWLDTNTIKPIAVESYIDYPDEVIQEDYEQETSYPTSLIMPPSDNNFLVSPLVSFGTNQIDARIGIRLAKWADSAWGSLGAGILVCNNFTLFAANTHTGVRWAEGGVEHMATFPPFPFADNEFWYIRFTVDTDAGEVALYYSSDNFRWKQLGSTYTGSINEDQNDFIIAIGLQYYPNKHIDAQITTLCIYDGIGNDSDIKYEFNFADYTFMKAGETSGVDYHGNTFTLLTDNTTPAYVLGNGYRGFFNPFVLRTRMRPGPNETWSPKIHSGYLYDQENEYYMYASPNTELAVRNPWVLGSLARQGAPIIVWSNDEATPKEFRQIAPALDGATPVGSVEHASPIMSEEAYASMLLDSTWRIDSSQYNDGATPSLPDLVADADATFHRGTIYGLNYPTHMDGVGEKFFFLPGWEDMWMDTTVPTEFPIDELDVRFDADLTRQFPDVNLSSSNSYIIHQGNPGSGTFSFAVAYDPSLKRFAMMWSENGSTVQYVTTRNGLEVEGFKRLAFTFNPDNGFDEHVFEVYEQSHYQPRNHMDLDLTNSAWSLVDRVVTAGTTSLYASTDNLSISDPTDYTGAELMAAWGRFYRVSVRDSIDGDLISDLKANEIPMPPAGVTDSGYPDIGVATTDVTKTTFPAAVGDDWYSYCYHTTSMQTIIVDRPLTLIGNASSMRVPNNDVFNSSQFTFLMSFRIARPLKQLRPLVTHQFHPDLAHQLDPNPEAGWRIVPEIDSNGYSLYFGDGTNIVSLNTGIANTLGKVTVVAAVVDTDAGEANLYVDGVSIGSVDISSLGDITNTEDLVFGGYPYGDSDMMSNSSYEFFNAVMWDRVLTEYEIQSATNALISDTDPMPALLSQRVYGSGTNQLFLAYEDVYNVTVTDVLTGETVDADTSTETHILTTVDDTDRERQYEVTYVVKDSFYTDNEYVSPANTQNTMLVFDRAPSHATPYSVSYELSAYDPATPTDVALNSFYSVQDEGFIYISTDEYPLAHVELRMDPSGVVADGADFALITVRSFDKHGNPKPHQEFTMETSFGILYPALASSGTVVTDAEGFAVAGLIASSSTTATAGTITITGDVNASLTFDIFPEATPVHTVDAVPSVSQIPADGTSSLYVHGKVYGSDRHPVAYPYVVWRKARSLHDLFELAHSNVDITPGSTGIAGRVLGNEHGAFNIGPFVSATPSDPGMWFVATESSSASPSGSWDIVGDVVYWNEYADTEFGVDEDSGLPIQSAQLATPVENATPYSSDGNAFPLLYDEATRFADATPVDLEWLPPKWYALDRYTQYQLGLLGNDFYEVDLDNDAHPDYRDH